MWEGGKRRVKGGSAWDLRDTAWTDNLVRIMAVYGYIRRHMTFPQSRCGTFYPL